MRPGAPGPNCGPGGIGGKPGIGGTPVPVAARTALTIHVLSDWPRLVASLLGPDLEGLGQAQGDARGLGPLVIG